MGVVDVFWAVFSTRESYYRHQVKKANAEKAVSKTSAMPFEDAIAGTGALSAIVSGYDDGMRAAAIAHFIDAHSWSGDPILLLHNGNKYLTAESLNRYGYNVKKLFWDPLDGLNRQTKLAILCPDESSENEAFFWLYAMDVCEAIGMDSNLTNLASIDWTGLRWQAELLKRADKGTAIDLIRRYDNSMARDMSKCVVRLERILRGAGASADRRNRFTLDRVFGSHGIYEGMFSGEHSELTKRVFEKLNDEYERRSRFVLILDNVYLPNQAVIKEAGNHVVLMMSGNDVGKYEDDIDRLTRKNVYVCLFRHDSHAGVQKLSRYYFGNYKQMIEEHAYGSGRNGMGEEASFSITYRQQDADRLLANTVLKLSNGCGFIRIPGGYEGKIRLAELKDPMSY